MFFLHAVFVMASNVFAMISVNITIVYIHMYIFSYWEAGFPSAINYCIFNKNKLLYDQNNGFVRSYFTLLSHYRKHHQILSPYKEKNIHYLISISIITLSDMYLSVILQLILYIQHKSYTVTIIVPLILKVWNIIFFMKEKHIIGNFKEFLEKKKVKSSSRNP